MTLETAHDRRVVDVACARAGVDDDVDGRQIMLMVSKRFANQALQVIAADRITDDAGCNGQSQPSTGAAVGADEDCEQSIGETSRILVDAIEVRFVMETLRRSERPCGRWQVTNLRERDRCRADALHRQAFTTLRASTSKHLSAGTRSHARTKAVGALTMNFARLVSTLHDESQLLECFSLTGRRSKSARKTCAKTITWWVKRKGGKGTQRGSECQAECRTPQRFCQPSDLWITSLGWV